MKPLEGGGRDLQLHASQVVPYQEQYREPQELDIGDEEEDTQPPQRAKQPPRRATGRKMRHAQPETEGGAKRKRHA